eukprot:6177472-Pleurochrysis_carterae.AAC.1
MLTPICLGKALALVEGGEASGASRVSKYLARMLFVIHLWLKIGEGERDCRWPICTALASLWVQPSHSFLSLRVRPDPLAARPPEPRPAA